MSLLGAGGAGVLAGLAAAWKEMGASEGRIESESPEIKIGALGELTLAKSSVLTPETTRTFVRFTSRLLLVSVA